MADRAAGSDSPSPAIASRAALAAASSPAMAALTELAASSSSEPSPRAPPSGPSTMWEGMNRLLAAVSAASPAPNTKNDAKPPPQRATNGASARPAAGPKVILGPRDVIVSGFRRLAIDGLVDVRKTRDVMAVWDLYDTLNGQQSDCTQGVRDGLRAAAAAVGLQGDAEQGQQQPQQEAAAEGEASTTPAWLTQLADESACYAWVTAVGSELLLHCNHRFSDLFLTTSELRDRLREKHIVHDLVWASLLCEEDWGSFYDALAEVLFRQGTSTSNVRVKTRTRDGGVVPCLATMRCHSSVAADGIATRGFCLRLWPLLTRCLDEMLDPPASREQLQVLPLTRS